MSTAKSYALQAAASAMKSEAPYVVFTTEKSCHGPAAPFDGGASNPRGVELVAGLSLILLLGAVLLTPLAEWIVLGINGRK